MHARCISLTGAISSRFPNCDSVRPVNFGTPLSARCSFATTPLPRICVTRFANIVSSSGAPTSVVNVARGSALETTFLASSVSPFDSLTPDALPFSTRIFSTWALSRMLAPASSPDRASAFTSCDWPPDCKHNGPLSSPCSRCSQVNTVPGVRGPMALPMTASAAIAPFRRSSSNASFNTS